MFQARSYVKCCIWFIWNKRKSLIFNLSAYSQLYQRHIISDSCGFSLSLPMPFLLSLPLPLPLPLPSSSPMAMATPGFSPCSAENPKPKSNAAASVKWLRCNNSNNDYNINEPFSRPLSYVGIKELSRQRMRVETNCCNCVDREIFLAKMNSRKLKVKYQTEATLDF